MGSGNSRMEEVAPVRRTKRRSVASFFCGGAAAAAAADDAADSSEIETRLQEDPVRNQVAANFTKSSTKELQNSHSERSSNQPSTSSDSTDDLPTGDLHSSEISENYSYPSSILATPIQEHSGRTVINTEAEGISENEPSQTEETSSLNNRSTNNNINNNTNNSSNRRSIWETFSRHGSRRNSNNNNNNNNNNNETSDGDELAFYDRWLDLGDEIFGDSIGDELRSSRRRRHASSALNWQSRSLIRERGGRVGSNSGERRRNNNTPFCPNGLHPDGMCACTVFSSAEASISRIVMLTEALFEVLDEIHRHPTSLSLSSTSHQAPESVVNSLPLKTHKKSDKIRCNDDVEQCYICLTEYEEGEKIRVLPCNHEFHMSCVDKWLKEVHRVCPLCRGDVCENTSQSFS